MDMHLEVTGNDRYALPPQTLTGGIYCSPWCGLMCTKYEYDQAVAGGESLARRMGDGWRSTVWENFGWHYKIQKGAAEIYPDIYRGELVGYTVFFRTGTCITAHALTPEDALDSAIHDARRLARKIASDLAEIPQPKKETIT